MDRFWKGIVVGLGGVSPGLSGTVLLIIFGLYQKTLDALGNILTNFKKNVLFLLPLIAGMFSGVLLFSKLIDFLLLHYSVPTRFCFLGLILGTLPMVWKELRKEGFHKKHYVLILAAAALGTWLFMVNGDDFPQITDPNLLQSVLLGIAVAATAIIPGVDPAVFLSSLGFYEMYVGALANFDLTILLPMVVGLALGAVAISWIMSQLFRRFYTATYSVIFGIFLTMIPNILTEECRAPGGTTLWISLLLLAAGCLLSYYLGDFRENNLRIRKWIQRHSGRF